MLTNDLKNAFLSYVELQRSAHEAKCVLGVDNPSTLNAYEKANAAKMRVLELIERLGNE